jgi:hypothetical protein
MPASSAVELVVQRRNTLEMLSRDSSLIILNREEKISDGGAGYVFGHPVSLPVARFKMVTPTTQLPERRSLDGQAVVPEFELIGHWNADVRRGDWYFLDGVKYEVIFIHEPRNGYEVTAEVAYRG